jgi:sialic acid synthase SpsE
MVSAPKCKGTTLRIGDHRLGPGQDIFFIAEIGINHNQDLDLAYRLIDAAAQAGCDAAKFQTFRAKDLYIESSKAGTYHLMGKDIPIYDLHTGLEMSQEWIYKLRDYCHRQGILFFSTPVARESVDLLDRAGIPTFKISSYDFTNIPLVRYIAGKKKPMILSTGAATLEEIARTVQVLEKAESPFALMQCIAKYPAPFSCANLAVMDTLRSAFQVPVGFSDNGFVDRKGRLDQKRVPLAAAAAGADLFEIHITLGRRLPGPDHGFATEPDELKSMVRRMRLARKAYNSGRRTKIPKELWGSSAKRTLPEEAYVRNFAYKCLFARTEIHPGERFAKNTVAILRPGQYDRGLDPIHYDLVLKARAARRIRAWQPLQWEDLLQR